MDRRQFLAAVAAMSAAGGRAHAQALSLRDAAREAYIYCLPLIEMAQVRARAIAPAPGAPEQRVNRFAHVRALAGPQSRGVTTPNNDTLYSSAWIDLSGEPVSLTIPPTGNRYFSLALMDFFTNNFAVLGTRTIGRDGATITLAGPRGPAPAGAVRSPTPWVWALGRTLVDGEADLATAQAIQDGLRIATRDRGRTPGGGADRDAPWNEYFGRASVMLSDNPAPATDLGFFRRIAALQLTPSGGFHTARFADVEINELEAGVTEARELLRAQSATGRVIDGWTYPEPNLGDFGQDYLLRARTALTGLAALPPEEAMYMRAVAPDGRRRFEGPGRWRLRLPGPLPVDGFWSLSMYEVTEAGQLFFTDTPSRRYAIGNRTPGLVKAADGAIDIWISRADPGGARSANWLPAPTSGPWALVMRAYLPKRELLDGRWRLPPLTPEGAPGMSPTRPAPVDSPAVPPEQRRRRRRRRRRG